MIMSNLNPTTASGQTYRETSPARHLPSICFEVKSLECVPERKLRPGPRHTAAELYQIIWVKKGSAALNINVHAHQICDNEVFLLSPGQPFTFQPVENVEGYSIQFSQELLFLSGWEAFELFHSVQVPTKDVVQAVRLDNYMQKQIQYIVLNMIKEQSNHFKSRTEALQGLLKMLIIHLSRNIEFPACLPVTGAEGELLRKFILMVNSDFCKKKLVSEYAKCLFISANYLNEVVKRNTGFTASYHIQQRVILEAKRLAINQHLRMKEISIRLGFEDFAHFSKFFKTNSGYNFTNFRKQLYQVS